METSWRCGAPICGVQPPSIRRLFSPLFGTPFHSKSSPATPERREMRAAASLRHLVLLTSMRAKLEQRTWGASSTSAILVVISGAGRFRCKSYRKKAPPPDSVATQRQLGGSKHVEVGLPLRSELLPLLLLLGMRCESRGLLSCQVPDT